MSNVTITKMHYIKQVFKFNQDMMSVREFGLVVCPLETPGSTPIGGGMSQLI